MCSVAHTSRCPSAQTQWFHEQVGLRPSWLSHSACHKFTRHPGEPQSTYLGPILIYRPPSQAEVNFHVGHCELIQLCLFSPFPFHPTFLNILNIRLLNFWSCSHAVDFGRSFFHVLDYSVTQRIFDGFVLVYGCYNLGQIFTRTQPSTPIAYFPVGMQL